MAENQPPKAASKDAAGRPFYEAQREHLKDLINKRRLLEKRIAATEESILQKETDYLENTPNGNIITGFDNYTKGTSGAARRKTGLNEANRVFSRSSISFNPNNQEAQTPASMSTPGASHAPTPMSSSFANKDAASAAATPTSATASKAGPKKKKASQAAAGDDSETDTRETKKVRTAFGAARK
ncbi:NuA4-domain-containing protein [Thozetella sp. PMI_491]|nr:NuA4-domain-containing protein [Thozetella sp. PMI_491]